MPGLTWTFAELKDQVARESGLAGDAWQGASNLGPAIKRGLARIWRAYVATDVGYYQAEADVVATPGDQSLALPADLFELLLLRRPRDDTGAGKLYRKAERWTQKQYYTRYDDDIPSSELVQTPGVYWFFNDLWRLRPVPTTAEVVKILYVTKPPDLVDDSDTVDLEIAFEQPLIQLSAGYAHNQRSSRQGFIAAGEESLANIIESWSTQRDRSTADHHYMYASGHSRRS